MPRFITLADPAALEPYELRIARLQARCYASPPWSYSDTEVRDYRRRLRNYFNHDGVRCVLALDGATVIGTAIGFDGPVPPTLEDVFYATVRNAIGPAQATGLLRGDPFEVVEIMIDDDFRRRRIGWRLLEMIVPASRKAWLITLEGSPAALLYRQAGWHSVDPTFDLWGRRMQIWALERADRAHDP